MTYAIDSNVLLDIFLNDKDYATSAIDTLYAASEKGDLIACDIVWAETSAAFPDKRIFQAKMSDCGISFSPMSESAALKAGELWKADRANASRNKSKGRHQVIPDFLIGAHALESADALITRDRGFLRDYFSDLTVIDPSKGDRP